MSPSFEPFLSILPAPQQRLWNELRGSAALGYVLYGGTAIALRLGHRISVDFDLFTERPLDRLALRTAFPFMGHATTVQEAPEALTVLVPDGDDRHSHVKVSFFGKIDFGRVGTPTWTHDRILQVASLDDLMATKVKVVLQRAEAKDYQDVVALLRANVDLARGLAAARTLYGPAFQPSESLKALSFFEDGDLPTLDEDDRTILIQAVSEVAGLPEVPRVSKVLALQDASN